MLFSHEVNQTLLAIDCEVALFQPDAVVELGASSVVVLEDDDGEAGGKVHVYLLSLIHI